MRDFAYSIDRDYQRVMDFLAATFDPELQASNWFPSRWEYMHYHPYFDKANANKIRIWEMDGDIVAIVHYEMRLGEAYFEFLPGYEFLKEEMFLYALDNLYQPTPENDRQLILFLNESEEDQGLTDLAVTHMFERLEDYPQCMSVFDLSENSLDYSLPEGFSACSLAEENDLNKISRVLWRGFNHPGEPDMQQELADRKLMQSAPNYDKRLNVVIKTPDGHYGSYAGIWYEPSHNIAYVEPVATDPDDRRMGLGKAAVLESIKAVHSLFGADKAYVGTAIDFYLSLGFKELYCNWAWKKIY
ncbi:MAG TPA: GNAT family N-acetyltransferase [Thermotogota bacterium]|nr:GNAT family N-acetyltransferase [Thermotogota bacterium]HRW34561.1 GNAT family N-acetyltransferase [Thermotogota bacterium]